MIVKCIFCKCQVMPMRDGRCPACQNQIVESTLPSPLSVESNVLSTDGQNAGGAIVDDDSWNTQEIIQHSAPEEFFEPDKSREILKTFEAEWQLGTPDIRDFLSFEVASYGDKSLAELLSALIVRDLSHRWNPLAQTFPSASDELDGTPRENERLRLQDYIRIFPELGSFETLPDQLIAAEFRLRLSAGEKPELSEYTKAVKPERVPAIIDLLLPVLNEKMTRRPVLCRGFLAALGRTLQWLMLTAFLAAPFQSILEPNDVPRVTHVFLVSGASALFVALAALGKHHPHDVRRVLGWRRPTWLHTALCFLIPVPIFLLMNGVMSVVCWQRSVLAIDWTPYIEMYAALARQPLGIVITVGCCLPAVAEEIFFRGFLGRGLVAKYGPVPGVLLTSLFFGLCHVMPDQAVYTFVLGIILHIVYLSSKSIFAPMIIHALNNLIAFLQLRWMQSGYFDITNDDSMYVPAWLVVVSAIAAALSLILVLRTRISWLVEGIRIWTPGFVSAEIPPAILRVQPSRNDSGRMLRFSIGLSFLMLFIAIVGAFPDWIAHSDANIALSHADAGDLEQADVDSRRAVEAARHLGWVHAVRGHVLSESNDFSEAKESCDTALRLDPSIGLSYRVLGWVAWQENRFQDSVDQCSLAIERLDNDAFAYTVRGAAYLELECFQKSLLDTTEAIRRDPTMAWAFAIRGAALLKIEQLEPASIALSTSLHLDPTYTFAWSQRARVHFDLKNFNSAISDARKALSLDPLDLDARHTLGLSLEETGNLVEVIDSLTACLGDADTEDPTRLKIAHLKIEADRPSEAIKDLDVIIQRYSEDEDLYALRSRVFSILGETEKARRDELHVEIKHEARQVAEIWQLNSQKMHQRAFEVAEQLLLRCPDSVQGLAARAASQWHLKNYTEAITDYTTALGRSLDDAELLTNRGNLYLETENYENAIADFTKAIGINPRDPCPYYGRANAWQQIGQTEKADADSTIATGLDGVQESTPEQ